MIYDEGFELSFDDLRLFAFSKYQRAESGEFQSVCGQTLVGWWKNEVTSERGCYKGFRVEEQHAASQNTAQAHVVQPDEDVINFAQDGVNVRRDSRDHERIVERLNLVQKSWTAAVPEEFRDFSIAEMNGRAGTRRSREPAGAPGARGYSFLQTSSQYDRYAHYARQDVTDLPKEFSWAEQINEPIQQKDCGSCYAVATMEMLSARIRINYDDPIQLSPQASLDCNYYNQGCDGGYGYLVSKYYTENVLITEQCYPYKAANGQCQQSKCEHSAKAYKVSDYK